MWINNIKVVGQVTQVELVTIISTLQIGDAIISYMDDADSGDLMLTVIDSYAQAQSVDITSETTFEQIMELIRGLEVST